MSSPVLLLLIATFLGIFGGENMAVGRVITVPEVKCRNSPGFIYQKIGKSNVCFFFSRTGNNFTNAKLDCEGKGARLAVVNMQRKRQVLDRKPDTWIGLEDRQTEGKYIWHDGTEQTARQRTDFSCYGQPDNWDNAEDCLHASKWCSAPRNINDDSCTESFEYLCEKVG
uniref:C-type lectin domain-containing protein n=1 Tax=Biomphalaria glabrata TaxID=6526 RepID=A0A2C9K4V1_BIOGL